MHIGVHIAQNGPLADPAVVRASALAAEELGYRSVWVEEPAVRDLDPLLTLTYIAASTSRVRLGTCALKVSSIPGALLARAVTTLDRLSSGRLLIGLGASDVAELELTLDVLDAACQLPPPRQRPPVLLTTATAEGLDLVARRADGWLATGVDLDDLAPTWEKVQALAAEHGRDPDQLSFVVRAELHLDAPTRGCYAGSEGDVLADLEATRDAGAHEVLLSVPGDHELDRVLDAYATMADALS